MFISSYYYQVSAIVFFSLQVFVSFMELEWTEQVVCAELKFKKKKKKSPKTEKEV